MKSFKLDRLICTNGRGLWSRSLKAVRVSKMQLNGVADNWDGKMYGELRSVWCPRVPR